MKKTFSTPQAVRTHFPFFSQDLVIHYLDNGASSQKPACVIDTLTQYYQTEHANIHRGVYALSEKATERYEDVRKQLATFLHAGRPEEIVFTSGTTESLNTIAFGLGESLQAGDEILLTVAEHHANLVPWHMLAKRKGVVLRYIPLTPEFRLDLKAAHTLFSKKTKVFACAHVSNVLGVIHPIEELIQAARTVGAITVIDGAQGIAHLNVDVQALDCDFYAFSGHKMLGPTGIGGFYGKYEVLCKMPPMKGGGDMIESVTLEGSRFKLPPYRFEAGTPSIADGIALGAALDFLSQLDREKLEAANIDLAKQVVAFLRGRKGYRVFVPADERDWVGIVSFYHPEIHAHDVASFCDTHRVCVRAGHHCAQPLMQILGVSSTTRVSPYLYNTQEDIEAFFRAIEHGEKVLLG